MEAWINNFFDWIPIGGTYYALLGLLAFVESLAFVGLLCPGSVLIVFTGFLAANGKGDFVTLATVYALGAIAGDLLSYLLGARAGSAILQRPWFKKREALLGKAQLYFADHGGKSVFLGRFIGFLRPFIPFIAGSARMKPFPFILYALVSGVLWGISYPGLGYVCGASWQMVQVWSGRFSLLIVLLAALFLLNALFWRYFVPALGRLGRAAGRRIAHGWQALLATAPVQALVARHPRFWNFLCRRFTVEHASGICLSIGIAISLCFAGLFVWFGSGLHPASGLTRFDQRVYELLSILHHPWTDAFFAAITWLGSGQALTILGAFVLLTLIVDNRDFSALVFVFGIGAGELFNTVAKQIFNRPRPEPLFPGLATLGTSFPSGHAFTALLFYGLVVYFLLGTTRNWRAKILLVLAGSFAILLIGISRIVLAVHWTSDVLGGFALAALWLTFLITLCETRFRYGGFGLQRGWRPFRLSLRARLAILIPAAALCTGLIVLSLGPFLRTISLEPAPRSVRTLTAPPAAVELPAGLPLATETLFGQPQRPLSMIVLGDAATLQQRLVAAGWQPAQRTGFAGFTRLLLDLLQDKPLREGAIVPELVEGRMQDFSLVRSAADSGDAALHTLLVWNLGRRFADGREAWGLLATRQLGVQHSLGLPLPLPLNDRAVDRERDALAADFRGDPLVPLHVSLPFAPARGEETGAFVSDQRLFVVTLPLPSTPTKEHSSQ